MKVDVAWGAEYEDLHFGYHRLLFKILRGEADGADIQVLICDGDCGPHYDEKWEEEHNKLVREAIDVRPLIHRAVKVSPWIDSMEDAQADEWVDKISNGDADAALCLLVPLLVNLRYLFPPFNAGCLEEVVERIAKASSSSGTHEPRALGKLVLVQFGNDGNGEYGVGFDNVVPYAALPSVRRLMMEFVRSYAVDGDFGGWPADVPLSHASELYFVHSSVVPGEARRIAQGFIGPCKMRQIWRPLGGDPPDGMPDVEWDYFELGAGGTRVEWRDPRDGQLRAGIKHGTRTEIMELWDKDAHDEDKYLSEPATKYSDEINAMLNGDDRLYDWRDVRRDAW